MQPEIMALAIEMEVETSCFFDETSPDIPMSTCGGGGSVEDAIMPNVLAELICSEVHQEDEDDVEEEEEEEGDDEEDDQDDEELFEHHRHTKRRRRRRHDEDEEEESSVTSYFDPMILHHPHILDRLLFLESQMDLPKSAVDFDPQDRSEVLPYMRKIVASWMLEVCEEQGCDEAVFPLAISILDLFLSKCLILKEHLQLVACVCLLLASKTRQCNHFSLDLLCWYTDNSISPQSLRTWELAILSQMNWDVNVITAIDFLDVLLVRSACEPKPNKMSRRQHQHDSIIRRHAVTFIALCCTEPRFVGLKPSLMAASAIYAAVRGLRLDDTRQLPSQLCDLLEEGTSEKLISTAVSIEQVINAEIKVMERQGQGGLQLTQKKVVQGPTVSIPVSKVSIPSQQITATSNKKTNGICGLSSAIGNNTQVPQISEEVLV